MIWLVDHLLFTEKICCWILLLCLATEPCFKLVVFEEHVELFKFIAETIINPYPTAFPYGNGMVLHFYQQQESSTTKTVHKVINKRLKAYV